MSKSKNIILKGIPASRGIAEGRIKIMRSPFENEKLKKGDILVASEIKPEDVPVMLNALGIITDKGSILSHPAIISREFNIPAVMGTKYATIVLSDGMYVIVDGTNGIVYELLE